MQMLKVAAGISFLALGASGAFAQQASWPAFPLYDVSGGATAEVKFEPVTKASKKWSLCVLVPHMQDSYWAGVDYGLVSEAERVGVKLTILQAGGYENLPRQVNQFDDCLNSNADAILVAPISEAGLASKLKQAMANKIPQIVFVNPVAETPVTSKVYVDFATKGRQTGDYLKRSMPDGGKVAVFPGPQGSGWAESYLNGFKSAVSGSKLEIAAEKFGEAGVPQQLRLVEDVLQSVKGLNAIWGAAPAAEAAVGAVQEAALPNVKIVASYENQTMVDLIKTGKVLAFATEYPVMQGRIAVDLAVKALEGGKFSPAYGVIPQMVTSDNMKDLDLTQVLAPAGFAPKFSVN
jgi:periplasmic protein TorT